MIQKQVEQPHMQLVNLSRGYVVSRAIHAVASLGIADYMSDTPKSIQEIAQASHTNPEILGRVLNFLSGYGIFAKKEAGFALTPLSKPLQSDDPHSMRDVFNMVDASWWHAFAHLDKGIQTGVSPFFHEHGAHFFDFLSQNPQKQANFDKGMALLSSYDDEAIATVYDFGLLNSIVDVGGGRGGLSKSLAQCYPKLNITLFDTAPVINQLFPHDFPSNITFQKGDFFESVPKAQAYIYKGVLHDFNDEMVKKILKICCSKMPADATLFIAEQVIPEESTPHPNKTMDIVMMVLLGGRQRTLMEWKALVESCGFTFEASYKTNSLFMVMAFTPQT
jgi:C-methyltransferase